MDFVTHEEAALKAVNARLNAGPADVAAKLETLLARQKEMEQKLKAFEAKAAAGVAEELVAGAVAKDGLRWVAGVVKVENPDALRTLGSQTLSRLGEGVVMLGTAFEDKVSVVAFCSPQAIKAGCQAGKLIAEACAKLGGKGGGKPDFAMGGGKDAARLAEVLKL